MTLHRLPGGWCSVCRHGLARLIGQKTVIVSTLETPLVTLWSREIGDSANVDCWSHEATGEIRVGYTNGESGKDLVRVIGQTGPFRELGNGKSIQVLRKDHRWVAMMSRPHLGDGRWELVDIDTGELIKDGQDAVWSSMGIIDIRPDWTPVWYHPTRGTVTIDALKLQLPRRSGRWVSGQGSQPSSLLVAHDHTAGMLLKGEAREPKVCELADGRAAVISRVLNYGVAFAVLTPADVAALPKPTAQTPPPPPPPNEDDDMAEIDALKTRVTTLESTVKALAARVAQLEDQPEPGPTPEPEPQPPGAPVIDLAAVTWLGKASPLAFPVTVEITNVTFRQKADDGSTPYQDDNWDLCFPHTRLGEWPTYDNGQGVIYDRNICVFGFVNGRWYGDTAEVVKAGFTCKRLTNRTERDSWGIGPHTKHEPMRSWGPKSGEWFGLMVCTPVREGAIGDVRERSNVAMVQWP